MSFCQKNSASLNLASTTLSFPNFIKPFESFLFVTTKNSLVIFPFLSKVGKYFWWYCIVIIKISFGILRNFLSNSHNITFGWSVKSTTSSSSFGLFSIFIFFLFEISFNFFSIKSFLCSWLITIFNFLKKLLYSLKSINVFLFSSYSLSIKVEFDEVRWWKLKVNFFLLNNASIDFSGLPQFNPKSPHLIDFFHWIFCNTNGTNSSNKSWVSSFLDFVLKK